MDTIINLLNWIDNNFFTLWWICAAINPFIGAAYHKIAFKYVVLKDVFLLILFSLIGPFFTLGIIANLTFLIIFKFVKIFEKYSHKIPWDKKIF